MSRIWTLRDAVAAALADVEDRPGQPRAYVETFLDALEERGFVVTRAEP